MPFKIGGLQKTTLIDYPNKIACIVFTNGCNFHCGYCHNPELFENKEPAILLPAFFDFLKHRQGKLDGVVITGGEPTLQNGLKEFVIEVKSLGFGVKLDSNGTQPKIIEELLNENLLDYIAMDIKAPLDKYKKVTNSETDTNTIQKSIDLIMNSGIDYEFRTTVVKSQLDITDFEKIGMLIKGAKKYYLQEFLPTKTLDEKFMNEKSYTKEEFLKIAETMKKYVDFCDYR